MRKPSGGSVKTSRRGYTSPLGKLTAEVPKIMVDESTKEILERQAAIAGVPFNEFHRSLLQMLAHGKDALIKVEEQRLNVIAGIVKELG